MKGKTDSEVSKLMQEQFGSSNSKEATIRLIDLDLPRTFPSLAIFNNKDSPIYENLQNVLDAFVIARPDIGYVSGLSKSFICKSTVYQKGYLEFYFNLLLNNIIFQKLIIPSFVLDTRNDICCWFVAFVHATI